MNLSTLTHAMGAAKLALKAHAPTIMVVGGVASMAAGTVVACKQTLKLDSVLEKHASTLERVEETRTLKLESYSNNDARNDRYKVYFRASVDLAKLYAVPTVLFSGGCALVFGGHRLLLQRNATLALAYTGLKKSFDAYRQRVVEAFGPEADQGMLNGFQKEVIDETNGEVINVRDWEESSRDPYNRVFGQGETLAWKPDLSENRMFLDAQRGYAQELLNRRGYLYLSEVYEALGFDESDVSRVVGWKIRRNPDGSKDFPHVDFGLDTPMADDWKYNREKAIYLDFNCQGLIVGGKIQRILEEA